MPSHTLAPHSYAHGAWPNGKPSAADVAAAAAAAGSGADAASVAEQQPAMLKVKD
jgi:hypothetical protein